MQGLTSCCEQTAMELRKSIQEEAIPTSNVTYIFFLEPECDNFLSKDCSLLRRFWFSSSKRSYSRRNPSDCFLRADTLASATSTSLVFDCSSDSRRISSVLNLVLSSSTPFISSEKVNFPSSDPLVCFLTTSMPFLRIRSSLM